MSHKLPRGLYALITDDGLAVSTVLSRVSAVIEGGAKVLQLRLKHARDREALECIGQAVALARGQEVKVIVNDRADLALLGGAHGVHLGQDDLPATVARRLLGPAALIGVTTRGLEDIESAMSDGADYVGLGPVYDSTTKQLAHRPLGLEGFKAIAARSQVPVIAIAGISLATIAAVARAGAWGAAVANDLFCTEDHVSRVRALQQAFFDSR